LGAGDWRLATRDWHRSRVCHKKTSEAVLAWAEGDSVDRVVDVVMREGQMDKGAAGPQENGHALGCRGKLGGVISRRDGDLPSTWLAASNTGSTSLRSLPSSSTR
jgi:hypothetical protein